MFLLLTLFALFCAWIGAGLADARRERAAAALLTARGSGVDYDEEHRFTPWWDSRRWLHKATGSRYFAPVVGFDVGWGDDWGSETSDADWRYLFTSFPYARNVESGQDAGLKDEHLRHLPAMRRLRHLALTNITLTGDGLRYLKELPALEALFLERTALPGSENLSEFGKQEIGELTQLRVLLIDVDDALVAHLGGLTKLEELHLSGAAITDAALEHIGRMPWLRYLSLSCTKITDDGLRHLEPLHNLEVLEVYDTPITDRAIAHLTGLACLAHLRLQKTQITDQAVPDLVRIRNLKRVALGGTRITSGGKEKLRTARPDVRIGDGLMTGTYY